jgi:hypothetical protein
MLCRKSATDSDDEFCLVEWQDLPGAPHHLAYFSKPSDPAERATICPNIAPRMLPWCFRGAEQPKLLLS